MKTKNISDRLELDKAKYIANHALFKNAVSKIRKDYQIPVNGFDLVNRTKPPEFIQWTFNTDLQKEFEFELDTFRTKVNLPAYWKDYVYAYVVRNIIFAPMKAIVQRGTHGIDESDITIRVSENTTTSDLKDVIDIMKFMQSRLKNGATRSTTPSYSERDLRIAELYYGHKKSASEIATMILNEFNEHLSDNDVYKIRDRSNRHFNLSLHNLLPN